MSKNEVLFLAQSYMDTASDYERSLNREGFPVWDYIILTASNENQAEGFRAQINERINQGLLPKKTHFAVIPDKDGKRVGSGGATLGVIKYIAEDTGKNSGRTIEFYPETGELLVKSVGKTPYKI